MTLMEPVGIPSDVCTCGHFREDHGSGCLVAEDDIGCDCVGFSPDDNDWGYWYTDDNGRKIGRIG